MSTNFIALTRENLAALINELKANGGSLFSTKEAEKLRVFSKRIVLPDDASLDTKLDDFHMQEDGREQFAFLGMGELSRKIAMRAYFGAYDAVDGDPTLKDFLRILDNIIESFMDVLSYSDALVDLSDTIELTVWGYMQRETIPEQPQEGEGAKAPTVERMREFFESNIASKIALNIINDLTTGGTDKALSAEQGKVLFQNVDNGKQLLANAIIDKGQTGVSKESTFQELADKIGAIRVGYPQTTDGMPFDMSNLDINVFVQNNQERLIVLPNIFDTSKTVDMMYMFNDCTNLKEVPLFNTGNVTNMSSMFDDCTNLKEVPLFNTGKVDVMVHMFKGCTNLKKVPLFDTRNVTNMSGMFKDCTNLKKVPLFNTGNVTNMDHMFDGCTNLKEVPLFNTDKVEYMDYMFDGCTSLNIARMRELGWPEAYLQTAPNYTAP